MDISATRLACQERSNFVKLVIVTETSIKTPLETATEQQESASSVFTTPRDLIVTSVFLDISEILMHCRTVLVMLVLVIQEEPFKHKMEYQFVTKFLATVTANPTLSAKIVTNVKTASGTLRVEMAAKTVDATQLVLTIHRVTLTPANASASLESLG